MMDFDCTDWNTGTAATKLTDSLFGQHVKKSKKSKKRKNENLTKSDTSPSKKAKTEMLTTLSKNPVKTQVGDSAETKQSIKNAKKQKKNGNLTKSETSPSKKAKTELLKTLTKCPVKTQVEDSAETKKSVKNAKKQKKKLKKMEQVEKEQDVETKVEIKTDVKRKSKKKLKEGNENSIKTPDASVEDNNDDSKPDLSESPITDAKKKKKRKRKYKRNKFRDYAAEAEAELARKDTEESSTVAEKVNSIGPMQKNEKNSKKKQTRVKLDNNSMKLKNGDASKTLNKKEKKFEKNKKMNLSGKNSKPEDVNKTDDEKFDPQQLSAILSANPKATKAQQKSKKARKPEELEDTADKVPKGPKSLLEKSRERLSAARFRYLNEQMYTSTGREAMELFKDDPEAFNVYHEGFQGQVEKWPTNPIDIIIDQVKSKQKHLILADFGCGDAKLARSVPNKVHSFDLVALNDHVTACDMSKVPLGNASVDLAVFCLSLMGTNLVGYLKEAHRVVRPGGVLKIAEVTSRFHNVGSFVLKVEKMGFKVISQNGDNKMFVMMDFRKLESDKHKSTTSLEDIQLKPCLYKKR